MTVLLVFVLNLHSIVSERLRKQRPRSNDWFINCLKVTLAVFGAFNSIETLRQNIQAGIDNGFIKVQHYCGLLTAKETITDNGEVRGAWGDRSLSFAYASDAPQIEINDAERLRAQERKIRCFRGSYFLFLLIFFIFEIAL